MSTPVSSNRDRLCDLMVKAKASDLFLVAGSPVQLKINGVVTPVNDQRMMPEATKQISYELMSKQQIADFEATHEMNYSFSLHGKGNFRVNVYTQRGSVAMVIRYLSYAIPNFDDLNLPEVLKEVAMDKHGLILVVGATGSGKSTTIAAMLDLRARERSGHILTLEDPLEYLFPHRKSIISQREIGLDSASYSSALKNAMREAPDMLFIGEIRDSETMSHALGYAQSGHLCVSTLHANNSYHALHRILNFFPTDSRTVLRMELAASLKTIVSQRLVKRKDNTRIAAVEVLMSSRHIGSLIEEGKFGEIKETMEKGIIKGSQTFDQALYKLYKDGVIEYGRSHELL
jgi:twitching motility protein PilU